MYTLHNIYRYRYYILAILFALTLMLFWPGVAMHDSTLQYAQAVIAQFHDHHPPLMAYLWRSMTAWYPGSGLMFLLQLSMLYGGVVLLLKTVDYLQLPNKALASLILLIYPIYPQILIYEVVITKDAQFAASFVLCGGLLAYYTVTKKRIPILMGLAFLLILIYGTAVKYQAKYVVIVFAIWFGMLLQQRHARWRKIFTGALIYCFILGSVFYINNIIVPKDNRSYAWQYVKLYDLAAISVALDQDLIPDFNKTSNFTFSQLQAKFSYPAVDSLVFKQDPLLTVTKDQNDMHYLCHKWWHAVQEHPWLYIKHRANNMRYILLARPGYEREAQDVPVYFHNTYTPGSLAYIAVDVIIGSIFYIFMSNLPVLILGVFYALLAVRYWHKTPAAKVLFAFTSTALLMVAVLFFKSMAGTPRYTFISIVMIHAANVFAYACCTFKKETKKNSTK